MPMDEATFERDLLEAYRGERAGVVILARLLERAAFTVEERELAELFVSVETMVGDRLAPILERRGLPLDLDEDRLRRARERGDALGGWRDVVTSLGSNLEGHVRTFVALREAASTADRPALDLLVAHEIALMHFGTFLREGRADEARNALRVLSADFGRIAQKLRPKEAGSRR